jgi:hypothetical protein
MQKPNCIAKNETNENHTIYTDLFFFVKLLWPSPGKGLKAIPACNTVQAGETPSFQFTITNITDHRIKIPKQFIVTPGIQNLENVKSDIIYRGSSKDSLGIIYCNIDPEVEIDSNGIIAQDIVYLNSQESFSYISGIACYRFQRVGIYNIRFTLDSSKTGLRGSSEWVTLKIRE